MKQNSVRFLPPRQWLLLFALPLVNLLLLTYLVFHYAIDVPDWDQWAFIPFLDKAFRHQLTFRDFWAQHNEHRLLFPRLVMLVCAIWSHWNIRWELAVNIMLALGIYGVWVVQIVRTARQLQDQTLLRVLPITGLAVFSIRQQGNWTWGWQLQIFMNVLAVLVGFVLLAQPALTWARLAGAMCCGIIATYSFANGLLFWFAGAVVLGCNRDEENNRADKTRRYYWLAWCAVAVATIASYLYQLTPSQGSFAFALRHPLAVLYYICIYMGSLLSFMTKEPLSAVIGLAGLLACGATLNHLVKSRRLAWNVLAPYLGAITYVLLSAGVSAAGRAFFGAWQAMESRYTTISALFWVALLMLICLTMRAEPTETGRPRSSGRMQIGYGLACALIVLASLKDIHRFKDRYTRLLPDQQRMARGIAPTHELASDVEFARVNMKVLQQHQLTVYRNQ